MFAEQLVVDLEVWKGFIGAQGHHIGLGSRTPVERQTLATPIRDAVNRSLASIWQSE
jgi:hypothetical protein